MCDCIERVNDHLGRFNTKIELPLWSASGVLNPFVSTVKLNDKKRGKPRLMACTYCPFCGEKYAARPVPRPNRRPIEDAGESQS